jgi:hypothetical protein
MPKNQTISAKTLANWAVSEIRLAFPAQLRPSRRDKIAPALITVLLNMSNLSQGRVENIRTAFRDAVRERLAHSNDIQKKAVVMVEDAQYVSAWLVYVEELEQRMRRNKGLKETGGLRRSKRVQFQSQNEDKEDVEDEEEEPVPTPTSWLRNHRDATEESEFIPDRPPVSPVVPAPRASCTVFANDSLRTVAGSDKITSPISVSDDSSAEDEASPCRTVALLGRRKELEAKMQDMQAQETEHRLKSSV